MQSKSNKNKMLLGQNMFLPVSPRSTNILLSGATNYRNFDSLVPTHLSRGRERPVWTVAAALLLKHYEIGLWGQAGEAKGLGPRPIKRNTSRYARKTDRQIVRQKTDTFVSQLQSEITDHSCVLITNRVAIVVVAVWSWLSGVWWAHNRDRYAWATTCCCPTCSCQLSRVWRHEYWRGEKGCYEGGALLSISQLSVQCSSTVQLGLHKHSVKQIFHCQKSFFPFCISILYSLAEGILILVYRKKWNLIHILLIVNKWEGAKTACLLNFQECRNIKCIPGSLEESLFGLLPTYLQ